MAADEPEKPGRVRLGWVDSAKGIGIILVVIGHVLRGLVSSDLLGSTPAVRAVDTWIYAFHMPLFFLLSGLFVARGFEKRPGAFLIDRLAVLGYPYLVWSVFQTLIQMALGGYTNRRIEWSELFLILVAPVMQFWFLYALLLISLICYAFRRAGLGAVGALAGCLVLWAARQFSDVDPWLPLSQAIANAPYFAFGSVLVERGWLGRLVHVGAGWLAAAAGAGLGLVAVMVPTLQDSPPPGLSVVPALAGITASVALAILASRGRGFRWLEALGRRSLEIFVAHTIASAGLRIVLQKILGVGDPSVHLLVGTLGGLALPYLLAEAADRFGASFLFRYPGRRDRRPAVSR